MILRMVSRRTVGSSSGSTCTKSLSSSSTTRRASSTTTMTTVSLGVSGQQQQQPRQEDRQQQQSHSYYNKCLIIGGRGAMGLLHAYFLEQAGWNVALWGRPLPSSSSLQRHGSITSPTSSTCGNMSTTAFVRCGVIPYNSQEEVVEPVPLKASSLTTFDEVTDFLFSHNEAIAQDKENALSAESILQRENGLLTVNGNEDISTSSSSSSSSSSSRRNTLSKGYNCILCAVKAHDIHDALHPLMEHLENFKKDKTQKMTKTRTTVTLDVEESLVDGLLLMHNGLLNDDTNKFLDSLNNNIINMISFNGSTLIKTSASSSTISKDNAERNSQNDSDDDDDPLSRYTHVAKHMGLGPTILFPRTDNNAPSTLTTNNVKDDAATITAPNNPNKVTNNKSGQQHQVIDDVQTYDDNDKYNSNSLTYNVMEAIYDAMPKKHSGSKVVSYEEGQCETVIKLAVNIAINGMIAREALKDWSLLSFNKKNSSNNKSNTSTTSTRATIPKLTNGILNMGDSSLMSIAQNVARIIMWRASTEYPTNAYIDEALRDDVVSKRVKDACDATSHNICSTMADILSHRQTERSALLEAPMNKWMTLNTYPTRYVDTMAGVTKINQRDWIHATSVLDEINDILQKWDDQFTDTHPIR